MNVIDLPAWPPKRPDGSLNFDQLEHEWLDVYRHRGDYRGSSLLEYVAAIVERDLNAALAFDALVGRELRRYNNRSAACADSYTDGYGSNQ
jgi:hypothetical protein